MGKLSYCMLLLSVTLAVAQDTTIDPKTLIAKSMITIIGGPPTNEATGTNLKHKTVRPADTPTILVDKDGDPCKCVPYYLCDEKRVAVANYASVPGRGEMDIWYGEGDKEIRTCQGSIEVCCKVPTDPPREKPKPDSKPRGCGYSNPLGLGTTIVGGNGNEAQYGEFPWVVALLDALNETYVGVGVLIHPQVVMTGAHVAYKYGAGKLKVRAGEWDTQTLNEMYDYQERDVQEMYLHKDFQQHSLKNDVALLRLESPLELADHINMLCLPNQGENFDTSKACVASGWGKNCYGRSGRYAVILKKVEQDMVPHDRCNSLLQRTRLGTRFQLHSSFVCAGGEEGKDTCQGDGGAPLACPIGDDRFKLTGLVAWGIGCGQQDVPAVYAGVAQFRDWVDAQMNKWGYGVDSYSI